MSAQGAFLADLADTADDLGLLIRAVGPKSIELFSGADISITIESRLLSGALLRSLLRPRSDPAIAPDHSAVAVGFDGTRG